MTPMTASRKRASARLVAATATFLLASAVHAGVEINTANEAELDSVRGLGPASTQRILNAREAGSFEDWEDVMKRVKGIRRATAEKLSADGLTVNGKSLDESAQTLPE